MKVVIAIDSFKGSISSPDAGAAIREGIHRVFPDADVFVRTLADGGEGTVEALAIGMHGRIRTVTVTGPLGTPVEAAYGILDDSKTAIIEMSAAAGITLVDEPNRNPLYTTTYGVGKLSATPSATDAGTSSLVSEEVPQTTAVSVCFRLSDMNFRITMDSQFPSEPTVCQRLQQSTTHMFSRTSKIVTLKSPAM